MGSRIDNISSFLAKKFPNIEFISIDFGSKFKETNYRLFGSFDNLRFESGYALKFIEDFQEKIDVVILCGTSCVLFPAEYKLYLKEFARISDYLIISDIWTSKIADFNFFKITLPEDINPDISNVMAGWGGGQYIHNHVSLLENTGFKIHSSTLHGSNENTYTIHILGETAKNITL